MKRIITEWREYLSEQGLGSDPLRPEEAIAFLTRRAPQRVTEKKKTEDGAAPQEEIQAEGSLAKSIPWGVGEWLSKYFPQPDEAAERIGAAAIKKRGRRAQSGALSAVEGCLCGDGRRYYCRGKCPSYKCNSKSKEWERALKSGEGPSGRRRPGACWPATVTEKKIKKSKKKMKEIYNWQAKANVHKIKVKWINPRKFTGYAAREKLFEEADIK